MNNLPKIVTQRCLEQDLNPRPTDRKVQAFGTIAYQQGYIIDQESEAT